MSKYKLHAWAKMKEIFSYPVDISYIGYAASDTPLSHKSLTFPEVVPTYKAPLTYIVRVVTGNKCRAEKHGGIMHD